MELQGPIRLENNTYKIPISVEEPYVAIYTSREMDGQVTPPDTDEVFRDFCTNMANSYDTYSQRWFHKSVPIFVFTRNLTHNWDFGTHPSNPTANGQEYRIRQVWRPTHLLVETRSIQLQWSLEEVSYHAVETSGQTLPNGIVNVPLRGETDLLPLSQEAPFQIRTSLRERALRKVREARLQAAAAEARAKRLASRYYKRYGLSEFAEDSILSSDEDDN